MNNINNELKDVLSTLETFGENIKNNVDTLSKDINALESKIESDSKTSLDEIKSSLSSLKTKIESSVERFTSIEEFRDLEHSKLMIKYYSTIIFLKNDYMNDSLKITDRLNQAFQRYNKERNTFYITINGIMKDHISSTESLIKKCVSFILKSLDRYKDTLSKYSELFSSSFSEITKELQLVDSIFNKEVTSLNTRLKNIKDKYSLKVSSKDLLDINFTSSNSSLKSFENITIEYSKKRDKIINDFKANTAKDIERIEYLLLSVLDKTYSLSLDKDNILDLIKDDEYKDLSSELLKIDKHFSLDEFKDVVNQVFKTKNEKDYLFYKDELKNLELSYKKKLELYGYIKAESDEIVDKLNNESIAFYNEYANESILKDDYDEFYRYTKERINTLFEYKIKTLSLFKTINEITYNYEYEKSVIESSFMKEIRDSIIDLDYDINIIKNEAIVKTNERNTFMVELDSANKKSLYLLDYETEKIHIEKEYRLKKSFLKLAYELFKQEKDIALLDTRVELEKILSEYDAIKSTYEAIYVSQEQLLTKNKERVNMLDISNYDYALSFLKHRTLIAEEMIDLAIKEYTLRVDILNGTRNMAKDYLEKLVLPIIDTYLNDCKELNRIKNEKLEPIIDKLSKRPSGDATNGEVKKILDNYNEAIKALTDLLLNDKSIKYAKFESRNIDEAVINSIENAQIIRDQSLKRALEEIERANLEFESIIKSIDQKDIDFDMALEDYKLTYLTNKARLDNKLEKDSVPYLDKINDINNTYNNDDFIKRIDSIERDYEVRCNKLLDEYKKKTSSLPIINYVNYENELLLMNEKSKKEHDSSLLNSKEQFFIEKNTAYKMYLSNIKKLDIDYKKKAKDYESEINRFKLMILDMTNDMILMNKKSLVELKNTSYLKNIFVLEGIDNIEKEYKTNIKRINKEISKKYKNITIYDMKKR